ncbi:helix-turn-helix domain-containing GNAT family N-acetyltransferase [Insolitispirillum peregrinum]|uniref:Transcriptional regulator, MarR family with acetyltransferase activity n=1 Tax=Insolitispirillum peregrinum TaxID=80876 RepID=A0A1N7IIC8_9PROT|nr:helix-turn-helix domain-containing GNAT family N-acetyltransferase [Insolitispirillum peregrinum]SIS36839.1 transcriptional regulator, MarR family with acetyltransferase activity [Insolitispirillum peregrinum]
MTAVSLIQQIRSASRTMVRELGFMESTLAGTNYSPSAVHALLEIEASGSMTSAKLVQILGLEKSSVSRLVNKLIDAGEISEISDSQDGRVKNLILTENGKKTVGEINVYGELQVESALKYLSYTQQKSVAQGIAYYAQALKRRRLCCDDVNKDDIYIVAGYVPGIVGSVTEMHARFYSNHSNFGQFFESQVARGLAEFVGRLNNPCNNIFSALKSDRIVGSISVDGENLGDGKAHLRWFILDDGCRGGGIGRQLLRSALEFVDKNGFDSTQLWTFKGLDVARRLYESSGFVLVNEQHGDQWGSPVVEQHFKRECSESFLY